jgi:hypothetical protein
MAEMRTKQAGSDDANDSIMRDFFSDWDKRRHLAYSIQYVDVLESNEDFIYKLHDEFAALTPVPKFDLFLADEVDLHALKVELEEDYSSSQANLSPIVVLGVQRSKYYELGEKFGKLVANNKLPAKHYGRHLTQTPTVQILKIIAQNVNDFRHSIFENMDVEQDAGYAKMIAGIIADEAAKISIIGLGKKLIEYIVKEDDDTLMFMLSKHLNENQREKTLIRYRNLKRYFLSTLKERLTSWQNSGKMPYTHREVMIAHSIKVGAQLEKFKTAKEWKVERGNACYNDFYTLQKGTKNKKNPYKEPTLKELNNVIELLADYTQLQQQVRHKIESL